MNTSTPRVDGIPASTEILDTQSFWETADRKTLQQLLTGNTPAATYSDEDVFGYMSNTVDFSALPRRVAIGVSSRGNFFMAEIARVLEDAFRQLGTQVRMFSESEAPSLPFTDPVLIVAPHEFFLLGNSKKLLKALTRTPALIMVNTEQPQTRWFGVAETYLRKASAVLDVNFESARHLAAAGYKAFVLPLAYSDYIARTFDGSTPLDHGLFGPLGIGAHAPPPAQYSDRPIDILFVGTASPRRDRFFAGAAHFLANKNCFLYMPDGGAPFAAGESRTIDTAAFVALAKRSKILLNIHRDDVPYLEWQRIVTFGIMQKTLVVTDHCSRTPCLEPNVDYLDGPLEAVPRICELALDNCDIAEAIAERALERLQANYPMEQVLGRCFTALAKVH